MPVFHKPYAIAADAELDEIPKGLTRNGKTLKARPAAVEALKKLCSEAEEAGVGIVAISAHRTFDFQKAYFLDAEKRHGKGKGALWVAPAGYSEHHTGLVFDLADKARPETDDEPSFEGTPASDWLKKNAGRFGFELSFKPGNRQGVGYEPWHWRYAGDREASDIFHPGLPGRAWMTLKSILKTFGFISAAIFLAAALVRAEVLEFKTLDGTTLEGDFWKPSKKKTTVILLHGYLSHRGEWESFAQFLNSRGIGVFALDLRGHGKSQGQNQDFSKMVSDVDSAVEFLSTRQKIPRARIGVAGASIGANIALRYAVKRTIVPFAILLSPGMNYQGLTAEDAMIAYGSRPLLMVVSSNDSYAYTTVNQLEKIAKHKALLTVLKEGPAGHGVQMFRRAEDPNKPSDLEKKIVNWIERVSAR